MVVNREPVTGFGERNFRSFYWFPSPALNLFLRAGTHAGEELIVRFAGESDLETRSSYPPFDPWIVEIFLEIKRYIINGESHIGFPEILHYQVSWFSCQIPKKTNKLM